MGLGCLNSGDIGLSITRWGGANTYWILHGYLKLNEDSAYH